MVDLLVLSGRSVGCAVRHERLTRLALQIAEIFSSLVDLLDVIPHDADGLVDLCLDMRRLVVAWDPTGGRRSCTAGGRIRVVAGLVVRHFVRVREGKEGEGEGEGEDEGGLVRCGV